MVAPPPHTHGAVPGSGRPFGRAEDLGFDFDTDDRPALVTGLLACCGEPGDAQFWWAQPVGARIAGLLRLLASNETLDHLELQARCLQSSCAELFEFELPVAMLIGQAPESETVQVRLADGRMISVRLPNGRDLSEWRVQRPASRQDAIAALLASLVVEGQATVEDEPALAEALSTIDPLVAFTVDCTCPLCGAANEVRIDLEDIVLARFNQRQLALMREIHGLASHYGWTEAEILAVPASRRAHYLDMIGNRR
ncbi:MAG: hypothetical protein NTX45_29905 [Proteobacteria bacterium]|nr:hypothetical protein [Pseudomonadota bacterium]